MHQQQTAFENIVGKGEIACNKQFLLFPRRFYSIRQLYPHLSIFLTLNLYLLLNWTSQLKWPYQVKGYKIVKTKYQSYKPSGFGEEELHSFLCSI